MGSKSKRILEILSDRIKGKAPKGARRHKDWKKVKKKHLKENPECVVCASRKKLTVHHIVPFHLAPDLELEPSNLITLCEKGRYGSRNCHLLWGHRGAWQRTNHTVREDVYLWRRRLQGWEDQD